MWLVFAAPDNFFATESASHVFVASVSHFFMWLVRAAPATFFASESALHESADALPANTMESAAASMMAFFIVSSRCYNLRAVNGILGALEILASDGRQVDCDHLR